MKQLLALLLLACAPAHAATPPAKQPALAFRHAPVQSHPQPPGVKPNVYIFVFDDLGAGDTAATPALNGLALLGASCTRAYAYPTCSPARLALLAGIYPRRESIGDLSLNPLATTAQDRLRLSLLWLPELLAGAGYSTALVGKDHLGRAPLDNASDLGLTGFQLARAQAPVAPFTRGFAFARACLPCVPFCGPNSSGYYAWWRADHGILALETTFATTAQLEAWQGLLPDMAEPRFIDLSWSAPHEPYDIPPGGVDTGTVRGNFLQLATDADLALAQCLASIDISQDFVIVTSDNGTPDDARPAGTPSLRWKGTTFEDGIRVPLVIAGPGIVAGTKVDRPVSLVDLSATLAAILGLDLPAGQFQDSLSFADALGPWLGVQRDFVFAERYEVTTMGPTIPEPFGYDDQAILERDTLWPGTTVTVRMKFRRVTSPPNPSEDLVYNLLTDPFELHPVPLASPLIHPGVRARLLAELASLPPRAP